MKFNLHGHSSHDPKRSRVPSQVVYGSATYCLSTDALSHSTNAHIYERQSDHLEHSYFEKTAIKTSYSISRGVNIEFRNLTGSPRYGLRKTVTYAWKMVAIS